MHIIDVSLVVQVQHGATRLHRTIGILSMSNRSLRRLLHQENKTSQICVDEVEEEFEENESIFHMKNPFQELALHEEQEPAGEPSMAQDAQLIDTAIHDKTSRKSKNNSRKAKTKEIKQIQAEEKQSIAPQPWSIQVKCFDIDHELRRIFGSGMDREQQEQGSNRVFSSKGSIKSLLVPHLIRSNPSWMKQSYGHHHIGIKAASVYMTREYKNQDSSSELEFVFAYNKVYQILELEFFSAVESFDPEAIQQIIIDCPSGHIHALLAMSDIYRHQGHYQQASECVERALFIIERAFHPLFRPLEHHLDYDWYENRPIFLAIFRHIDHIGRKGCWKSALEFCKLLFQLDKSDPLGVIHMIDFYALQARQYEFLLSDAFDHMKERNNLDNDACTCLPLPHYYYSRALALYNQSQKTKETPSNDTNLILAEEYLRAGIQIYPNILLWLCGEKGISMKPSLDWISDHANDMQDTYYTLIQRLYVERHHTVWKHPSHTLWLEQVVFRMSQEFTSIPDTVYEKYVFSPCAKSDHHRTSLYRHVYLLDDSSIKLPSSAVGSSVRHQLQRHDPFPPSNTKINVHHSDRGHGASDYDSRYEEYFLEMQMLYSNSRPASIASRLFNYIFQQS